MPTAVHDVLQPGDPDELVQCVIKRDRTWKKCTYTLSLGSGSPPVKEGTSLLAAQRVSRFRRKEYVIYSDGAAAKDVMSKGSGVHVVGKLRSNTKSTSFTIYETEQLQHNGVVPSNHGRSTGLTEVFPGLKAGNFKIGQVDYDREVDCDVPVGVDARPRRMRCALRTIPASTIDAKGFAQTTPMDFSAPRININDSVRSSGLIRCLQSKKSAVSDSSAADFEPLVLKSRAPWWNQKIQEFSLPFGRPFGGLPSAKTFQLVAPTEPPNRRGTQSNQDKVFLQLRKTGKDIFKMDYRYPFSAFQAFAICVSSCEYSLDRIRLLGDLGC